MLTKFHNVYNNSKLVTVKVLAFLSGCIADLLKVVCSPPKDIFSVNKELDKATVQLVEQDCKLKRNLDVKIEESEKGW